MVLDFNEERKDNTQKKDIKRKKFEDLTIRELMEITNEFLIQNPDFKTAEDVLDQLKGETKNAKKESKDTWRGL